MPSGGRTAGVLTLLMGPLTGGAGPSEGKLVLTGDRMWTQLIFQLSVAGIVLMIMGRGGRDVVRMLGLEPSRIKPSFLRALLWITPVYIGIAMLGAVLMHLLEGIGGGPMEEQIFVRALRGTDAPRDLRCGLDVAGNRRFPRHGGGGLPGAALPRGMPLFQSPGRHLY